MPGKKINENEKKDIIDLYNSGKTALEIKTITQKGLGSIYNIIKSSGINPRELIKNGDRKGRRAFDKNIELEILQEYQDGHSLNLMCEKYKVSTSCIKNIVLRNGGLIRHPGHNRKEFTDSECSNIIEKFSLGDTVEDISKLYRVNPNHIKTVLKREGLLKAIRKPDDCRYVKILLKSNDKFYSMSSNGYVKEHRYRMAQYLNRPLESWETVHHKDGNRQNNDITNLQLRIGQHGKHISYCCQECGSLKLKPVNI